MGNSGAVLVKVVSGEGHVLTTDVKHNGSVTSDGRVNETNADGLDVGQGNTKISVTRGDEHVGVNVELFAGEHPRRTCSHDTKRKNYKPTLKS